MAGDGCRQVVVHLAGQGSTVWARHEIGARTAVREHLHGNAGLVHRLQSSLADVGQEFERVRAVRRCLSRPEAPAADCAWIDSADQGWNRKMLFERHDTHWQFLRLLAYHIPLPQSLGRCIRRRAQPTTTRSPRLRGDVVDTARATEDFNGRSFRGRKAVVGRRATETLTAHSVTECNGIFCNSCGQLHSAQVWGVSRTRA